MEKLTSQEQQEVIRYIEAEKPLPDKYRFLLFDDKREEELVWNGKTGEVCNIVLPFQTIEQVDEPRSEKPEDTALQFDLFATDTRGRLLKGWTNKLIWGDTFTKNPNILEEIAYRDTWGKGIDIAPKYIPTEVFDKRAVGKIRSSSTTSPSSRPNPM
jgi:hypothetical protein